MRLKIDRRTFLAAAGTVFADGMVPRAAEAASSGDALFASACRFPDGAFGAVIVNERGEAVQSVALPDRGHDVVRSPGRRTLVAFARRPGNFAVAFALGEDAEPVMFTAPRGRHFFGHGAFSADGRLLYATENDFEAARGCIGVYDATGGFVRIGEIDSHGAGPHEILLMPDGRTLAVCNGGVETHPAYGRAKLNVERMRPSLAFVDAATGALIERHEPPSNLHQLSIRHMAIAGDGTVVFGCQYEGLQTDRPPLCGTVEKGGGLRLIDMPGDVLSGFRNYVGSVAMTADGEVCALSSPRGNVVAVLSPRTGRLLHSQTVADGCGLAFQGKNLIASSGKGAFGRLDAMRAAGIDFDNHLQLAREG